MTKSYFPFDAGAGANITEDQWRKMAVHFLATGVLKGELNQFAVFADSTGMQVKVPSGRAWMVGHFFESDAQETLAIAASNPTNPRIDRVVVRANFTTNTIDLAIVQGTPAASPVAPALTLTASQWEISLAQVLVDAAVATIAANKITDERLFSPGSGEARGVLAFEKVTADQTGFTAQADVTDLNVWVVVGYNRMIRVTHYCPAFSSTVAADVFAIIIHEGGVDRQKRYVQPDAANTKQDGGTMEFIHEAPSEGFHNYKIQVGRSSGTGSGSHIAEATAPAYILVEDIGPMV